MAVRPVLFTIVSSPPPASTEKERGARSADRVLAPSFLSAYSHTYHPPPTVSSHTTYSVTG